jgi:hypothetical protein
MSSISATINGSARLVDRDTPEEVFYRQRHLENNTFDSSESTAQAQRSFQRGREGNGHGGGDVAPEDGGRGCFVAGEEVRVVVADIKDVRISDWKGGVHDWTIVPETRVNGVGGT